MALAANKNDLYEHEEVEENDGKELAKELGAIFQKTSAKEAYGVEDLFTNIGKKSLIQIQLKEEVLALLLRLIVIQKDKN